ncbi:hypothetical protein chiPu_0030353, partial [Chiloscyllium punctatum]|nr:hypothetical protein [Chiloscyllium punctatum]
MRTAVRPVLLASMEDQALRLSEGARRSSRSGVRLRADGVELPPFVIHMQIVRIEQACAHQP